MDDITQRIRRVTEDLRAIQEELGWAAMEDPSEGEQTRLLDELLEKDLINDFKSSVDHMRHFLWSYIESVSKKQGKDVDYALQAYRMQRVTEMLRILRERVELPKLMNVPEAHSFFEEIQAIANTAVDRHFFANSAGRAAAEEAPPDAPPPSKNPS